MPRSHAVAPDPDDVRLLAFRLDPGRVGVSARFGDIDEVAGLKCGPVLGSALVACMCLDVPFHLTGGSSADAPAASLRAVARVPSTSGRSLAMVAMLTTLFVMVLVASAGDVVF
jgi:hypothetical protein